MIQRLLGRCARRNLGYSPISSDEQKIPDVIITINSRESKVNDTIQTINSIKSKLNAPIQNNSRRIKCCVSVLFLLNAGLIYLSDELIKLMMNNNRVFDSLALEYDNTTITKNNNSSLTCDEWETIQVEKNFYDPYSEYSNCYTYLNYMEKQNDPALDPCYKLVSKVCALSNKNDGQGVAVFFSIMGNLVSIILSKKFIQYFLRELPSLLEKLNEEELKLLQDLGFKLNRDNANTKLSYDYIRDNLKELPKFIRTLETKSLHPAFNTANITHIAEYLGPDPIITEGGLGFFAKSFNKITQFYGCATSTISTRKGDNQSYIAMLTLANEFKIDNTRRKAERAQIKTELPQELAALSGNPAKVISEFLENEHTREMEDEDNDDGMQLMETLAKRNP